jgi:hypothetical protein
VRGWSSRSLMEAQGLSCSHSEKLWFLHCLHHFPTTKKGGTRQGGGRVWRWVFPWCTPVKVCLPLSCLLPCLSNSKRVPILNGG